MYCPTEGVSVTGKYSVVGTDTGMGAAQIKGKPPTIENSGEGRTNVPRLSYDDCGCPATMPDKS